MAIGAIIGSVVGEVASSALSSGSKSKAGKKAAKLDYLQYLQRRKDVMPYMEAGKTSTNELARLMEEGYFDTEYDPSRIAEDPAYQFRMEQGQKAINRGSAASGEFFSGQRGKALTGYGQNLAAEEYAKGYARDVGEKGRKYGRLYDVGGRGYSAASGLPQSNAPQYAMAEGANKASMYEGMGGAVTGGIQNYMIDKYLKPQPERY